MDTNQLITYLNRRVIQLIREERLRKTTNPTVDELMTLIDYIEHGDFDAS